MEHDHWWGCEPVLNPKGIIVVTPLAQAKLASVWKRLESHDVGWLGPLCAKRFFAGHHNLKMGDTRRSDDVCPSTQMGGGTHTSHGTRTDVSGAGWEAPPPFLSQSSLEIQHAGCK